MASRCRLLAEAVEELGFKVGKDLRDFNFRGTDGSRGHLYDTMRSQDEVLGPSAGPFVSKVHEANRLVGILNLLPRDGLSFTVVKPFHLFPLQT